jgi:3-oxoacyl-(acyl-carrier-protein) synthase
MTDEQFEKLISKLDEINQNIILITAKDAGKDKWNLSDVYSELSSITSAVGDVETAVNNVKSAVDSIDLD